MQTQVKEQTRGAPIEGEVVGGNKKKQELMTQSPTPGELLRVAMQQKADPQFIRELMQLQREWEAHQARKAFTVAMTRFRAEPMVIEKRRKASFQNRNSPGMTEYDYADLSDITEVIAPAMAKHDLSYRWDVKQREGLVFVKCITTHADGHSEEVELFGAPDQSGNKNSIQAVGSVITYLEKYTLLATAGMATKGMDNDGAGGKKPQQQQQQRTQQETPQQKAERERREKFHTDWFNAIDSCSTLEELEGRRQELIRGCGGSDKVPQNLQQAFITRKRALEGGAR